MKIKVLSIVGTTCAYTKEKFIINPEKVQHLAIASARTDKPVTKFPYACFLLGNQAIENNVNMGFTPDEYKLFIQGLGLHITYYNKQPLTKIPEFVHINKDNKQNLNFKGFIIKGTIDMDTAKKAAALFSLYNTSSQNIPVRQVNTSAMRFKVCTVDLSTVAVGYKDFLTEGDTLSRESYKMTILPKKKLSIYLDEKNKECIDVRTHLYNSRDLNTSEENLGLLVFPVEIQDKQPQEIISKLGSFALNNCRGVARKRSYIFNPSNASIMIPRWTNSSNVNFGLNVRNCDSTEILNSLKLLRILGDNFQLKYKGLDDHNLKISLNCITALDKVQLTNKLVSVIKDYPNSTITLSEFVQPLNITKNNCYTINISNPNIMNFESIINSINKLLAEEEL